MRGGLHIDESVEALRSEFEQHADAERAAPMAAYMKHRFPFHGLPKPIRAEIQRPFVVEWKTMEMEWIQRLVERLWQLPEREYQYVAMDLLMAVKRKWKPESLDLFEALIREKSWWDSVDSLASRMVGGVIMRKPVAHRKRIMSYAKSEDLWLNRTALIHQLFYKEKTDTALFEEVFECCGHKTDFFIQKAVGWALRQYSATDPVFVEEFVERHGLKGLARREALRKIGL